MLRLPTAVIVGFIRFASAALRLAVPAVAAVALAPASARSQVTLEGAGASFPYPLYSAWFDAYSKVDPSVHFNYQSIGSSEGQRKILEKAVDFGASDGPMTDQTQALASGKILHIPTVAGAVAITFDAPGVTDLNLDGKTLAAIFLGKITKWNDPAIARLNPAAKLPHNDLVPVHRSDGSGTTFIFSGFLSSVSPEWKQEVGANSVPAWTVGIGARGNEGVFDVVAQTRGAIGYVELTYALRNRMPMAAICNRAEEFVKPGAESIAAALSATQVPADFRFSMVDREGSGVYPISGASWLLVYEKQSDPVRGKKLVEFLRWMIRDGEKIAPQFQYVPLPDDLRQRVSAEIETINVN